MNILFNNGELIENMTSAITITGTPNLTPRAYYLLDVLAKKLMKRLLTTKEVSESILDYLATLSSLRTVSIPVEEYASKVGLHNLYVAQDRLTQSGLELNSFFTSYNNTDQGPIFIEIEEEEIPKRVGFIQNLTKECKVFDGTGNFEIEFNPELAEFLIKKYRNEEYKEFEAEDYTADFLIRDLMLLGASYLADHGFKVEDNFPEDPEKLGLYIKNHFILGSDSLF